MRRRRRQNPLLAKTIGIGVLVTVILLPILAEFGLFKKIKEDYIQTTLINLPPPPPQPKEAKPKAKKANHAHPHLAGHHETSVARSTSKAAPLPVHVAAATGTGNGANTIVNGSGGGQPGQVPVVQPMVTAKPSAVTPPAIQPVTPPAAIAPIPPPPHVPVLVPATLVSNPEPVLPDDLEDSPIDSTFKALFTIHADGTDDVRMIDSTGNDNLDQLALDAAKRWKFKPATKDGQPIDSYLRLNVEFIVS